MSSLDTKAAPRGQVTGRDGYIIAQSLLVYPRQQKLPDKRYEWSNTEDAKLLLLTQFPGAGEIFSEADQIAGCEPANLEPLFDDLPDNIVHLKP